MGRAVEINDVRRSYGAGDNAVHALRGVTFSINEGELVALTGPSGSGKTTLLNCLLGLDQPDAGTVQVFDTAVQELTYEQAVDWRREAVAIVFQSTGLIGHLTARENVDIALRIRGVAQTDRQQRIDDAFERMDIGAFANHRPGQMSGGQQQRVSLARAIAVRPRLLVADEPTGELDTDTTATVLAELQQVSKQLGTTMILATHDHDVEAIATCIFHMVDGVIAP